MAGTARKLEALHDLKEKHGDRLWLASLDVTDTPAVHRVVGQAFAIMGRIDVVVSNAGYGLFGAAEEVSDEQISHQIATNLVGSIQVIRAALPRLRAQGGGRVLQVASEGGQVAYPNFSLYHATKWGIEGFVEAVAQEVAPCGIEFTLVEPGPAKTNFAGGLVSPPPLAEYDQTPSGEMRRALASGGFAVRGDAVKMAGAIIDSADGDPAPKRLTLDSGSSDRIRAALVERVAALDAQKTVAFSTEADA